MPENNNALQGAGVVQNALQPSSDVKAGAKTSQFEPVMLHKTQCYYKQPGSAGAFLWSLLRPPIRITHASLSQPCAFSSQGPRSHTGHWPSWDWMLVDNKQGVVGLFCNKNAAHEGMGVANICTYFNRQI
jgi:hypothetical protein